MKRRPQTLDRDVAWAIANNHHNLWGHYVMNKPGGGYYCTNCDWELDWPP